MRPGNIRNFGDLGEFSFLGRAPSYINRGFGKDQDFEAPGVGVPPAPASYKKVELAPGVFYQQDERCNVPGQRMDLVKCDGPDCDPGETEAECAEDPEYVKITDTLASQLEKEEALKQELEDLDREDERQRFDQERAARKAARDEVSSTLPAFETEEEGISPVMIAIIGGGLAMMLGLTFVMMRRKPAAAVAARKKRKRR